MGVRRRRFLQAAFVALVAAAGAWLWMNASMARLSKKFIPEMHRLEALRDGLDAMKRAVVRHDLVLAGLPSAGPLLDWSWRDLTRIEFAEYDVLAAEDRTSFVSARVSFTVGGFAADGSRVERSATVPVRVEIGEGDCLLSAGVSDDGWAQRSVER